MSNQLKFEIIGEDKAASAAFKKVSTASDETGHHLGKLGTIMAGVFAGNLLTGGAEKAIGFLKESVNAAIEDQRAEAMLTQTLHNVAGATDAQTEAVKKRLLADGEHLGIMQDQMMPAFQKLVMVTHSTTEATGLLSLTENLAAAKHIQLADAAGLVAKMTMGSNRVFKEFGIQVQANTTAIQGVQKAQESLIFVQQQVASGALSGAKAQKALEAAHKAVTAAQFKARFAIQSVHEGLAKVTAFTKGDAAKAADTYSGRLAQMHVRFHDLQVMIGNEVLPKLTELMGFVLNRLIPAFDHAIQWIQANLGPKIKQAFEDVKQTVGDAVTLIEAIWKKFGGTITSFLKNTMANVIQTLKGAFQVVHGIFEIFSGLLTGNWHKVWDGIKNIFRGFVNVFLGDIKQMWNYVTTAFHIAGDILGGILGNIWKNIKRGWNDIVSFFGGLGDKISSAASGMWNGITSAFKSAINVLINAWDWFTGKLHIHVPSVLGIGGFDWNPGASMYISPLKMATGGVVMPRPGGTLAQLAEAGHAEAVIPLDGKHSFGGGTTINIYAQTLPGNESATAREIQRLLVKRARETGNLQLVAAFGG